MLDLLKKLLHCHNLLVENIVPFKRKAYAEDIRVDLNNLLKKDNIIKQEDKILLYKLYKKLQSEFEDIK